MYPVQEYVLYQISVGMKQGSYFVPPSPYISYEYLTIPIYWDSGNSYLPTMETIQNEMATAIEITMDACTNNFQPYKDLGYEIDLGATYDYTTDVQFGLGYGYFRPGKTFESPRKAANQIAGSMKVTF